MARGTANCKCLSCGKDFTVSAIKQNRKDADNFVVWAETNITECKECEAKRIAAERAAENAKNAAVASEKGWPELTGSEKQAAWANTIREQEINGLMKYRVKSEKYENSIEAFDDCLDELLQETKASWWINNRGMVALQFKELLREFMAKPEQYREAKATEPEALNDEATVAEPTEKAHEGIVEIRAAETLVSAQYRKDEAFRAVVKALGYSWNADGARWELKIGVKTGTAAERAAELGNKLLNAGFAIRIQNPETLRNAVEGNYEPMTQRWISRLSGKEIFSISWGRDDLYSAAKKLPGARYVSPCIQVPAKEFRAVLDFAETYGFRFTPAARRLLDELDSKTRVVTPAPAKEPEYAEKPLETILESSRDVLDDLRDDP